ncbi:MAG: hypothetical protein OXE02_07785 [Chloroflexi bacterium]|nr:hypothetical protein [Chloroflexota bacterium]
MLKMLRKIGALGATALALSTLLIACGGEDPTPTPRPAATPTPTAAMMAAEPTPTPEAMMEEEATPTPDTSGSTGPAPTPTPVPRPTPTPLPVDPGFDAEAYFKGKTISMMVGYNPGGGTDAQARFMSRAWPEYIPGNPRIVVRNLTPNVVQRNFVWNSKPDGLTLGLEASSGIFAQFTPTAEFDLREITMIGITSGKEGLWVIRGTMPYDCIDSAFDSQGPALTVGTSAPTPADLASYVAVGWLADRLNVPLEIRNVSAAGSAEQYVMIERGDVNSWVSGTIWDQYPRTRPGWTGSGFIRPFADLSFPGFDLGHNGEADFHCPNVADEYFEGEELDLWVALRGPQVYASKNIIGPAGIPNEVTAVLRTALADAMANEEFANTMQDFTGIKNAFTHGDVAAQELTATVNSYINRQAQIDEITQAVFDKYVR